MTALSTQIERQQILVETIAARERAESLLRGLLRARTTSERHLAALRRTDVLKQVTGSSSLENAINSTRRMIDALDRAIASFERDLDPQDLALLDELRG
ncbi:MAG: hypothetical protein ACF8SC_11790 [Phycisphaerales bacterium JB037]